MKKNNEEISIIVPIYNVEKYVEKCLLSLLNQTYKNIKVWAIIDGSPDNSIEIVKKMEKQDSRIVCIDKENGGYGSALEYAIKNMKSKYFIICDPDDWLDPFAVEKLYKTAVDNNLDIVIGDKYNVYIGDSEENKEYVRSAGEGIEYNKIYEGTNVGKLSFCQVSPHSKLYRTEICKKIEFEHKVSYTDFTLFIVALNNSKRVMCLNEALSYYLCDRPGNTATDTNPKVLTYYVKVWHSTFNQLKDKYNNFVLYRMYIQAKEILKVYSTIKNKNNLVTELNSITNLFAELEPFKNVLYSSSNESFIKRMMLHLFMNKCTRKLMINLYIKIK